MTNMHNATFGPLLAAALLSLAACSSTNTGSGGSGADSPYTCISGDFDCRAEVEITESVTNLPQDHNSLNTLPVGNVKTGDTIKVSFNIRNNAAIAAAAALKIVAIKLDYLPVSSAEDGAPAFTCTSVETGLPCEKMNGKWRNVVPAGLEGGNNVAQEQININYKRYDNDTRTANLFLKLAGDPKFSDQIYMIRFATKVGSPKLKLSPDVLSFSQVKPNSTAKKSFDIINTGDADLLIKKFDFLANPVFELSVKDNDGKVLKHKPGTGAALQIDPPISIPKNEKHTVDVVFAPTDDKGKEGKINIGSNDPSPEAGVLLVNGNANLPCMTLKPTGKLNFGGIKLGEPTPRDIVIENCGGTELVVHKIDLGEATNSDEFKFNYDKTVAKYPNVDIKGPKDKEGKRLRIPVNKKATFTVLYTPEDKSKIDKATNQAKPDIAEVRIHSNAFSAKNTVLCDGIGVVQTCPSAKVIVKEGEEVIPQTMLHLKGDQSKGTGGAQITKYQWKVKQPAGSNQVFVPGKSFPNPTFTANAAGEYEFCLDVWDQNEVKSCAPGCIKVLVLPEEAIHVELLWDTPADPDQTDTGPAAGADMDLHFAHPLANGPDIDCDGKPDPWFSNPFDTFWFNPNPNWGSASPQVNDDPSLDLDDTDGGGPENLNLDDPEGKLGKPTQYAVGAHYWSPHGFGTSFATINVYIMGVLAVQIDKVEMDVLDMWYVGKINWPNSMSGGVLSPFQICYKSKGGDPCKKTGKFWQPQGDYCVTKCYVNPAFTATQSGASKAACKN